MSPESIRTHGCSRISILISVILNSLSRMLSHVFYSSHSAYYVWLCSFLKAVWSGSVNNLNLRHLVRSNELRVNNESFQSSVRSACSGLSFSNRTESKQCENKLSSKQRNPQEVISMFLYYMWIYTFKFWLNTSSPPSSRPTCVRKKIRKPISILSPL